MAASLSFSMCLFFRRPLFLVDFFPEHGFKRPTGTDTKHVRVRGLLRGSGGAALSSEAVQGSKAAELKGNGIACMRARYF